MGNTVPKAERYLLNPNYFTKEQIEENTKNILEGEKNFKIAEQKAIESFLSTQNQDFIVESFRQKYLQEQELRKKYMITDLSVFYDKLDAIDNDLPLKNRLIEIIKLLSKLDNIEEPLNDNDSQLRQRMVRDIMRKLPDLQQNTFYTLKDLIDKFLKYSTKTAFQHPGHSRIAQMLEIALPEHAGEITGLSYEYQYQAENCKITSHRIYFDFEDLEYTGKEWTPVTSTGSTLMHLNHNNFISNFNTINTILEKISFQNQTM